MLQTKLKDKVHFKFGKYVKIIYFLIIHLIKIIYRDKVTEK